MAQILQMTQFVEKRHQTQLADVNKALDAVTALSVALEAFAQSVKVFGDCLQAEPDASEQHRMLEAWNTVRSGLTLLVDL